MHENTLLIRRWAAEGQHILIRFGALWGQVWSTTTSGEPETDHAIAVVANAIFSTGDSALYLVQERKPWDAEILLRSVVEGTYRIAFLCHPDKEERERRVREFTVDLPNIDLLRAHDRAWEMLSRVPDRNAPEWRPYRDQLLSDEEREDLRNAYPRQMRRTLEQRWSFSEMARWLDTCGLPGTENFALMLHGYKMSSHAVHADWLGGALLWERHRLSPERLEGIELAHAGRIVMDVVHCMFLRLSVTYRYKGFDHAPLIEVLRSTQGLVDQTRDAQVAWHQMEYVPEE